MYRRKIRKVLAIGMVMALVALVFAAMPMNVSAEYTGNVTIDSLGVVNPSGAPISVSGTTYTLTDDIAGSVTIQLSGITLDGDGYTVDGKGTGFRGVFLQGMNDVTVTNLKVEDWTIGIQLIGSTECTITENTVSDIVRAGVAILFSSNGNTVTDNMFTNCGWGTMIAFGSSENTITENSASECTWSGIAVENGASSNTVEGNTISDCNYGISIGYSTNNIVKNNVMEKDSIVMWGDLVGHWNTHTIDTTNTVNDKPVYYWKDVTSGKVPKGAGQVILANCQNVDVNKQDVSYGSVGILIGHSSNCKITKNTASHNTNYGIYMEYSEENTIKKNKFYDNGRCGITLAESQDNTIEKNKAKNSPECGIWLISSDNNNINKNKVTDCVWGIYIETSSGNLMTKNHVSGHELNGITVWYSETSDNTITCNIVKDNGQNGILIEASSGVEVKGNIVMKNGANGVKVIESDDVEVKCNIIKCNTDYDLYWDESGDVTWGWNWYKTKNWS